MPAAAMGHIPVLADAAIAALAPRDGGTYLDGTVGMGGHAELILRAAAPTGRLIGLDRDRTALREAEERLRPFGGYAVLVHGSFADAAALLAERGIDQIDGALLDLGVSSLQLDTPERGFSFRFDAPLDMRFDPEATIPTAADLLNTAAEEKIADILYRFGEEPRARRIARAIVAARPLRTTSDLVRAVERVLPSAPRGRISPATRVFQAVRIAVNGELDALVNFLDQAAALLRPGGRLVVISFHSLEDRLVKQFIQRESRDCLCPPALPVCRCGHRATFRPVTRGAVQPDAAEIARNPRARSARLRAAERL